MTGGSILRILVGFLFFFILIGCSSNDTDKIISIHPKNEISVMKLEKQGIISNEKNGRLPYTPQYLVTDNWVVKPISTAPKNVVLITIDDAPAKHALQMARTLKELNAKAIFFVNGHFLKSEEQKQVLKTIYDMGFSIGNHTKNHKNLMKLSEEEQFTEIVPLNGEIEKITGSRPAFFRAPFGANTAYSKRIAAKEGMILMNWSYGYDWESKYNTKETLTTIMVNSPYLHNGSILLMHDRDWTNEALKGIVEGIRSKGYEIMDPTLIENRLTR